MIAAAVLVVLLAAGGILYGVLSRRPNSGSQATFTHGSLIYEVQLGSKAWASGGEPSPDPAGSATIGYTGNAVAITIKDAGAGLSGEFDGNALKNYVADLEFNVDAGSDFEIDWAVRGQGPNEDAEVGLNIQVAEETMTLFLSPNQGDNQALTPAIPIAGVQGGKRIDLGMIVNGHRIQLFIDGKRVADVAEARATGAITPRFYMGGKRGTLHFISLRYYAVS